MRKNIRVTFDGANGSTKAVVDNEVGIRWSTGSQIYFGIITHITPKGLIDVVTTGGGNTNVSTVKRFTRDGIHQSGGFVEGALYRRDTLIDPDAARAIQLYNKRVREACVIINSVRDMSKCEPTWSKESFKERIASLRKILDRAATAVSEIPNVEEEWI